MKYGFIKVAAATPNVRVADCEYNTSQIIAMIHKARNQDVSFLVFPELCVTAYTCSDLFLQKTLLSGVLTSLAKIEEASRGYPMLIAVGAPLRWKQKLYNCAVIFFDGKILGVVPKTYLPNYTEFYEQRHFTPAPAQTDVIELNGSVVPFGTKLLFQAKQMEGFTAAFEICEDLWVANPPSISHALAGAVLVGNLSASNETVCKNSYRRDLVSGQSARLMCGYVYADAGEGESTTDLVFAGHNLIAENGTVLEESNLFDTGMIVSEIDVEKLMQERRRMNTFQIHSEGYQVISFDLPVCRTQLTRFISPQPFIPYESGERRSRCKEIINLQAAGLKKRIEHTHSSCLVVGLSGGLDSTLALLITVRAIDLLKRPRTQILAVTMPCFGTTQRTRSNAEILAQSLGVSFREVVITESVRQHFHDIGQLEDNRDVTYENSQARERTQVLMDLANQQGGMVIGTGDLSELALGWATYNGDHMSMYGVNASIPKTLVRHLVAYFADHSDHAEIRDVLYDILDTPVSPELLPAVDGEIAQKTEDIVGPYELHDFFLYYMLRYGFSPSKIFYLAQYAFEETYSRDTILKWLTVFYRRFFTQQFKRSCLPDGVKVGSVAVSPRGDWRMPSDAVAALWMDELASL
jgi:NAD+ synthase (glutamine-hydrolysing)